MTARLSELMFLQLPKVLNRLKLRLFREVTTKSASEIVFVVFGLVLQ